MQPAAAMDEKTRKALRLNALLAASLGALATGLLFWGKLPFPKTVAWFSLFSSVTYFVYFLAFDLVCARCYRSASIALSQLGAVIISVSVYYTGGAVSPLSFLYLAILVSEALYGLENEFTVPACAGGYLVASWGIYSGLLPNPTPWAAPANASPAFLFIVSALLVSYLAITKNLSGRIINHLRARIESEASQKDGLLRKFSELNSTSQLGVLAHRIAHDLRGPIASISGYLQVEMLKQKSPEDKETLRELEEVVENMSEALRGITRFGRPGGGKMESIRLSEFVETLLAIVSFSPQSAGVRFSKTTGCEGQMICGSRADLQQAYFNIMKNAIEAVRDNPGEKTVELSAAIHNGDAVITVSDNGPGITPEIMASIFKKSVTTKKDGTGVGMLITRDLLARNDGQIELRNRKEGGLEVITRLPLS